MNFTQYRLFCPVKFFWQLKIRFENISWTLALLLAGLAYFAGLFVDVTGDSALYAAIARQMTESGDWLNLQINGVPYDQKPHLFFWQAALGLKLFGISNFAFKFFPFLYGMAGVYFTYRLGKEFYGREAGKLAALMMVTTQSFFLYFLDFHTDSVLQTGVMLALWQLAAYLRKNKPVNFVFGFLGIGLAMLAKGPVGAVLPFFAVLFYLLARKDFRQIFHPKWFLGVAISLAVISPALLHLYKHFGVAGIKFFFITNNFGRITGEYAGSSTDYFYYLYNALWEVLPWTFPVLAGVFSEVKSGIKERNPGADSWYLLGSVMVFLLILSIARGKAPNYFLITVPVLCIIAAKYLLLIERNPVRLKRFVVFQWGMIFLLVAAIASTVIFVAPQKWVLAITWILIPAPVVIRVFQSDLNPLNRIVVSTVLFAGAFNIFLNAGVIPELYTYQGARQALKIYNENKTPGSRLCNFEANGYEIFFYAPEKVIQVDSWEKLDEVMHKSGTWLFTNEIKYRDIMKMDFRVDTVYEIGQRGMNRINLEFINASTRDKSLRPEYLIVTSD